MVDLGPANGYAHVDRDTLRRIRAAGEHQLVFQASGMRAERTGFHAKVEVLMDGVSIAHDTFNVERNSDRVTLANTAYRQLAPGKSQEVPGYPLTYMRSDLDAFCAGLQNAFVEGLLPSPMAGSLERREPQFVLKPYILVDGGTILFAPPGQGKSYILWLMAVSIDSGLTTLWSVRKSRVLVVNLERSAASVADRLGNINQVLGLERDRPLHVLNARGRTLEQMRAPIARYIKQQQIGCILLDSLSRAGKGSLIDDDVVNAYCDILNGFEVAWLALAHSPRPKNGEDTAHVFGSQMFDAAADLLVKLTSYSRPSGTMGVSLDITKRNDIGRQPLWIGSFDFDDAGLTAVRRAMRGEYTALEGVQEVPADEKIARWLMKVGARSATQIAGDLGLNRSNVSALLASDARFAIIKKEGQSVLYGVAAAANGRDVGNTSDQTEELPF